MPSAGSEIFMIINTQIIGSRQDFLSDPGDYMAYTLPKAEICLGGLWENGHVYTEVGPSIVNLSSTYLREPHLLEDTGQPKQSSRKQRPITGTGKRQREMERQANP